MYEFKYDKDNNAWMYGTPIDGIAVFKDQYNDYTGWSINVVVNGKVYSAGGSQDLEEAKQIGIRKYKKLKT